MAGGSDWWLLVPGRLRRLPADLTAVVLLTAITLLAVITPGIRETPLRVVFGLPFVLFLPGYALVAALFPEAGDPPASTDDKEATADEAAETGEKEGIDGIERVALSFGLSIAVVPLLGLILNFTPFGIRLAPILVAISGFTIAMTAIAARRRWQLAPDDQFSVPYKNWLQTARAELTSPDSRLDGALNVLMVISILLAVSSVAYAVTVPKQGEAFTEHYLLTEQENGTLVADDYPTEFEVGETRPVIVGIGNHEHQDVQYSLVVELQDVQVENNSTTVLDETELERFQTQVAAGDTHHRQINITPDRAGTRLRLAFLLYKDTPPADPTVENAYRETHLWINVSNPE
ncbi:DUF1616 domain-containing protein [Halobacterium salinarum]|jgi:uncharacterized membrane protein|uniref:DUF1616 domain-containing protein n=1 Tax=Halobacterium salinarum TaxID=2242 RepID=UPI0025536DC1|nr:DUF1616 domain-containing protein [Halobacterium salinarum]MDL0125600.1 DUF1616 domain-containing protein [Halobacterium salinarum]MDL0129862.1 DUF1616 domain-containing protein [Halobacterium salinarum]